MSTSFGVDIHLQYRRISASLEKPEGQHEILSERPYACLFEWIHVILRQTALSLGIVDPNATDEADPQDLVQALKDQDLKIRLHGEIRELRVLELVLMFETKCTLDEVQSWCEHFPSETTSSVYDDYNIGQMVDDIRAFKANQKLANELLKSLGKAEFNVSLDTKSVLGSVIEKEQITLGILGNTGSGKTTLLNALLQETGLFPTDTDICTAIPSIISYAETPATEGFIIHTISQQEIDAQIQPLVRALEEAYILSSTIFMRGWAKAKKLGKPFLPILLKGEKEPENTRTIRKEVYKLLYESEFRKFSQYPTYTDRLTFYAKTTVDRAQVTEFQNQMNDLYRQASKWLRYSRDKIVHGQNSDFELLKRVVSTQCPEHWKPVIKHVEVLLHKPILKHIRLVDAAGLKDHDESRMELTRSILSILNGWVLVHNADVKGDFVSDLLKWLKLDALIPDGVICLTKVDALLGQSDCPRTFDSLLEKRLKEISALPQSTGTDTTFCSPKATEVFSRKETSPDIQRRSYGSWREETYGFQMRKGWSVKDCIYMDEFDVDDFYQDVKRLFRKSDAVLWQTLNDFQYELSGLISTVSTVVHLVRDLIRQKTEDSNLRLTTYLNGVMSGLSGEKAEAESLLASTNRKTMLEQTIAGHRENLHQLSSRIWQRQRDFDEMISDTSSMKNDGCIVSQEMHNTKLEELEEALKVQMDLIKSERRSRAGVPDVLIQPSLVWVVLTQAIKQIHYGSGAYTINLTDIYNQPLINTLSHELSQSIDSLVLTFSKYDWIDEHLIRTKLEGYGRNSSWEHACNVMGYEKIYQPLETVISQAMRSVTSEIEQTFQSNRDKFSIILTEMVDLLNSTVLEAMQGDEAQKVSLEHQLDVLESELQEIDVDESTTVQRIQTRIDDLTQKIQRCEETLQQISV